MIKFIRGFAAVFVFVLGMNFLYPSEMDSIPSFLLAYCALILAYVAYLHTREKFRLDLFDRRFVLYENTLKFCKTGGFVAGVDYAPVQASYRESIAGNENLAQFLFDNAILQLSKEIQQIAREQVIPRPNNEEQVNAWIKKGDTNAERLATIANILPVTFAPYFSFSNYRTDIAKIPQE